MIERMIHLKNGAAVWLRPIRPEDAPGLIDLYERLSSETVYQRFFSPAGSLRPTPPRNSSVPAGFVPFGVRVLSREEPHGSVVEEGSVQVEPFTDLLDPQDAGACSSQLHGQRDPVHPAADLGYRRGARVGELEGRQDRPRPFDK